MVTWCNNRQAKPPLEATLPSLIYPSWSFNSRDILKKKNWSNPGNLCWYCLCFCVFHQRRNVVTWHQHLNPWNKTNWEEKDSIRKKEKNPVFTFCFTRRYEMGRDRKILSTGVQQFLGNRWNLKKELHSILTAGWSQNHLLIWWYTKNSWR